LDTFHVHVQGCQVMNPGPFSTNEFRFCFYKPAEASCSEGYVVSIILF
jgi:hypothetical protein